MMFVSRLLDPPKIYVIRMYYVKKNCIEKLLHCYKGNLRTAVSSYDKPVHMNCKNTVAYGKYLKKTKKQSKKVNTVKFFWIYSLDKSFCSCKGKQSKIWSLMLLLSNFLKIFDIFCGCQLLHRATLL